MVWGILYYKGYDMYQMSDLDRQYMLRAMELAERGRGFVNPNPLVGAVVVKNGCVIGEGWHEQYGGLHAERNAFKNCTENPQGADLYVTLEPCCHFGKTPPCTDAIIENRIAKVIIGCADPNPLVSGKGMQQLRDAGIEVVCGVEEERLREQNRVFLKYITMKLPYVVLKTAMSLDGKIATRTGDSKWITGEMARQRVQQMRSEYMGIVAGIGTVLADDPMLNCRLAGKHRQPVRVVVDSQARIPLKSRLVQTAGDYPTIVACTQKAEENKLKALRTAGVQILLCTEQEGRVNVADLLRLLGARGVDSLLLEGGGELNYSFVQQGLVDEVCAFIAPKMIGGREAKTPVEGQGFGQMKEVMEWGKTEIEKVGKDVLLKVRK